MLSFKLCTTIFSLRVLQFVVLRTQLVLSTVSVEHYRIRIYCHCRLEGIASSLEF